jgi:heme exporter protein B
MLILLIKQAVNLSFRKGKMFSVCAFYSMAAVLFIFALGSQIFEQNADFIMCISMLFATLTTLPQMFKHDYEDGTLEQLFLQPISLELLIFAKIIGQWFAYILPVLLISPLILLIVDAQFLPMHHLLMVLVLASPTIVVAGAITSSLALRNKRSGLLQVLVTLFFYVPVLLFTTCNNTNSEILYLIAMLLVSLPIAYYFCAALVRKSL